MPLFFMVPFSLSSSSIPHRRQIHLVVAVGCDILSLMSKPCILASPCSRCRCRWHCCLSSSYSFSPSSSYSSYLKPESHATVLFLVIFDVFEGFPNSISVLWLDSVEDVLEALAIDALSSRWMLLATISHSREAIHRF